MAIFQLQLQLWQITSNKRSCKFNLETNTPSHHMVTPIQITTNSAMFSMHEVAIISSVGKIRLNFNTEIFFMEANAPSAVQIATRSSL